MCRITVWRLLACVAYALVSITTPAMSPLTAAQEPGASRGAPVPLGGTGAAFGYDITVVDVVPDAIEMVMDFSTTDTPPDEGNQFFLARVHVVNTQADAANVNLALDFKAVGAANLGYTIHDTSCGEFPEHPFFVGDLAAGESAEFNACWQVASSDTASLAMYVEQTWAVGTEPVWFSLGGDAEGQATPGPATISQAIVEESSQAAPVPLGQTGQAGNFQVTVLEVLPQADEAIASANPSGTPPEPGKQFFMATVALTNVGEDVGVPISNLGFYAMAEPGFEYSAIGTPTATPCGTIPNGLIGPRDVFPGGTIIYDICWQIDSADAESLVMFVDPAFAEDESGRAWFALRP